MGLEGRGAVAADEADGGDLCLGGFQLVGHLPAEGGVQASGGHGPKECERVGQDALDKVQCL